MSINKILEERQEQYGSASRNFKQIGRGWGAILEISDIPSWKVALMLDFVKSVRCSVNPNHLDSWLDKEGYTTLGKEIVTLDEPI
jgi:Domain of unknown function (DUF6378)